MLEKIFVQFGHQPLLRLLTDAVRNTSWVLLEDEYDSCWFHACSGLNVCACVRACVRARWFVNEVNITDVQLIVNVEETTSFVVFR